jgi:putative FmdB family regulatory protein
MPTYEYKCKKCNNIFEKLQSIKAKSIEKCPKCSGVVERIIGIGGGVLFKGSGFYQTDYRSKSYKEGKKKDKPSPSCPATGSKKECSNCPAVGKNPKP